MKGTTRWRWLWTVVALAISLSCSGGAPVENERPAVALIASSEGIDTPEWTVTALREILYSYLVADRAINVLDLDQTFRVPVPQVLGEKLRPADLQRLSDLLRTDYLIVGTVEGALGEVNVKLTVYQMSQGQRFAELSAAASPSRLAENLAATGVQLRRKLGLERLDASARDQAEAAFPPGAAGEYYATGLARLRKYRAVDAMPALEKARDACAGRPCESHPFVSSALAIAYLERGQQGYAIKAANEAAASAAARTPVFALDLEALAMEISGEWKLALDSRQEIFEEHPDDPVRGRQLAELMIKAGQADEALEILGRLADLPGAVINDGYVRLAEAEAAYLKGWNQQAIVAAKDAERIAEQVPGALDEADCRHQLCADARFLIFKASRRLGKTSDAANALKEARLRYLKAGNLGRAWDAISGYVDELIASGRIDEAEKTCSGQPGAFYQDRERKWLCEMQIASALLDVRDTGKAIRTLTRILEEVPDQKGDMALTVRLSLAIAEHSAGNLTAAWEHNMVAREILEDSETENLTLVLTNLAEIHFFADDSETALDLAQQSLEINKSSLSIEGLAWDRFRMAEIQRRRGHQESAFQHYQNALNPPEKSDEEPSTDVRVYTLVGLSRLETAGKRWAEALDHAAQAIALVLPDEHCSKASDDLGEADAKTLGCADDRVVGARLAEAEARLDRSRNPLEALRHPNDYETAKKIMQAAKRYVENGEPRAELSFEARFFEARIAAVDERPADARKILEKLAEEAEGRGFEIFVLDAEKLLQSLRN